MNHAPLSRTKLDGSEPAEGGFGVKLPYDFLVAQLVKMKEISNDNPLVQVDVCEDGVVLMFERFEVRGGNDE